tara:strand:- start:2189 stop:4636 length:2448 start_codon:yes stop_codon:yes gene_type:complete
MAQVITIAGERLFALKAQNNEQLDVDTFIFANVLGQDPNATIDRNEGLPPVGQIVHQQIVQQVGRVNDNVVIYSTVMDSLTGPFDFNWVGLYSSVNQTLIAVSHIPSVSKTITVPGAAGNTLNRNFGIEYSGIADLTGITVAPETWQLDFTARLSGMDELTRQLAADMNGKDWFIDDGFKVVPRSTTNTFNVTAGAGYVSGLRVELKQDHILTLQSYPQFVYVDAWFDGDASSQWSPKTAFTVTNGEMDDYIDVNGKPHYVFKLARITAADAVEDLRNVDGLSQKINKHLSTSSDKHEAYQIKLSSSRSVEDKLSEIKSVRDKGAAGDGYTIDTVKVQEARDQFPLLDEYVIGTSINKRGGDPTLGGINHNRTTGRVDNPKITSKLSRFGIEFLQHWFNQFVGDNSIKNGNLDQRVMVISGDSTTVGFNATYAKPDNIFRETALNNGYVNVGVVNNGHSSKTAEEWVNNYLSDDLLLNPDLYIIRWGANDPYFKDTSTDALRRQCADETLAWIRQGVSIARASRNVSLMSIVLCTPGPMNDVENGRDEVYFERLNAGIRQIALDYQCAFVDTYAACQAAHGAAGIWMDALQTPARGIHPGDVMYEHQMGFVAEYIMPKYGIGWSVNQFRNSSIGRVTRKGSDDTSKFKAGIDLDRMNAESPYNGVSFNLRQADGGILQVNYPMQGIDNSYTKGAIAARHRFNEIDSTWFGIAKDISSILINGWVTLTGGFGRLKSHLSLDGLITITGTLSPGIITNGTVIGVLPDELHPYETEIIPCQTDTKICEVRVKPNGNLELWNAGTPSYVVINGSFVKGA